MAKIKIEDIKIDKEVYKWKYICPACTNIAIWTTNKMLGVKVVCEVCHKEIELNDEKNYLKVK